MTTPENLNESRVVLDTTPSERKEGYGFGAEIINNQENARVVEGLQHLESVLAHDDSMTAEQLLGVEKTLDSVKVIIGGEDMTISELRKIPDLAMNVEIWKEVEAGDYSHSQDLTYITPRIAELLSKCPGYLDLGSLTSISDLVAEHLSKHQDDLGLKGLKFMTDAAAEQLSKHKGSLWLDGLTSISDVVAEHLSKIYGCLYLGHVTSISDTTAKYLSNHQEYLVGLDGLTSISDTVAKYLSKHEGIIFLGGLTSLSDTAARYLARHKEGISTNENIKHVIDSFK